MIPQILLTSFDIWEVHHQSNSSDDLLDHITQNYDLPYRIQWVRKLPVDDQLAPLLVINKIKQFQPHLMICCGMAESRSILTIESQAIQGLEILHTSVNLPSLIADLKATAISHDAGQFVCESLYYQVLKFLRVEHLKIPCIFVHVPLLTPERQPIIISDFLLILEKLVKMTI